MYRAIGRLRTSESYRVAAPLAVATYGAVCDCEFDRDHIDSSKNKITYIIHLLAETEILHNDKKVPPLSDGLVT